MPGNKGTYYVVHDGDGWAVRKGRAGRASARCDTQAEAIQRAFELAGRGVVLVQDRHGKFRELTPYD